MLHHFSGEKLSIILETEKEVNPQIGEKEKCSDLKWVKINVLPNKTTKKVKGIIDNIIQQKFYDMM